MAEWITQAGEALARLNGAQWAEKKKSTIVALADAHLAGRSEETVWDLPDVCARSTYHAKWKRDPLFAEVLATVDGQAKQWRDTRSLRALQDAAERLALASPVAVTKLLERLTKSEDESIIIRAAVAILDRAGIETGVKSSRQTELGIDVRALTDAELDALIGDGGPS